MRLAVRKMQHIVSNEMLKKEPEHKRSGSFFFIRLLTSLRQPLSVLVQKQVSRSR